MERGISLESSIKLLVGSSDIDANNHLNNKVYMMFFEWGRKDFYSQTGDIYQHLKNEGISHTLVNISINFIKEIKVGEELKLSTSLEKLGEKSYTLKQVIFNSNGTIVCKAEATSVFFNLDNRKSIVIPDRIRTLFAKGLD